MTIGQAYRKVFPASGYRSWLLSYPVIVVVMLAEMYIAYRMSPGVQAGADAASYIDAMNRLAAGKIDVFRTPIYPLWLLLLRTLFGYESLALANQLTGMAITIVGGWYFMRLAETFTGGRRRTTFWLTAVYAAVPQWNNLWIMYLQTETMAVAFTTITLYWLTRDLRRSQVRISSVVISSAWLFILVMLRPVNSTLLIAAALFWAIVWLRSHSRRALAGIAGVAVAACGTVGYMAAFKHTYGCWTLSAVSQWNNFVTVGQAELLNPDFSDNPAIKERVVYIRDNSRVFSDSVPLYNISEQLDITPATPPADISQFLSRAMKEHPGKIAATIYERLRLQAWPMEVFYTYNPSPFTFVKSIFRPLMGSVYVFLLATGFGLVILWLRRVRPAGSWLCWLCCMALTASSIIGAQWEWPRIAMPAYAAFLMLAYQVGSIFFPARR